MKEFFFYEHVLYDIISYRSKSFFSPSAISVFNKSFGHVDCLWSDMCECVRARARACVYNIFKSWLNWHVTMTACISDTVIDVFGVDIV